MTRRSLFLILVTIVLVGIVIFLLSQDRDNINAPTSTPEEISVPTPTFTMPKSTVAYSNSGYNPSIAKIKKGNVVVFDNKSSVMMWTASDVHPIHEVYPDSNIRKCETLSQADMFDACRGYASGESWEFGFDEQGTWKYHNHLHPFHTGIIIVE